MPLKNKHTKYGIIFAKYNVNLTQINSIKDIFTWIKYKN